MDLSRRKFLSFLAAPAVVTAANIMPVKLFVPPDNRPILRKVTFQSATGRWTYKHPTSIQQIPDDSVAKEIKESIIKTYMECRRIISIDGNEVALSEPIEKPIRENNDYVRGDWFDLTTFSEVRFAT